VALTSSRACPANGVCTPLLHRRESDEEAVVEDEAAYETTIHTAMEVPVDLVPAVRDLIAKRRAEEDRTTANVR
jgi:hypothetical protein